MQDDVRVREARVEDAPGISRVNVDSWRTTYSGIVPESYLAGMLYEIYEARWRRWLRAAPSDWVFRVAELSPGEIAGFATGGPRREETFPEHHSELFTAYLLREHQRKGLGRRLLGAVAEGLAAKGKRFMLAWVLAANPSRPFYEAMGGELLGRQGIQIDGVTLEEVAYGWADIRSLVPPE